MARRKGRSRPPVRNDALAVRFESLDGSTDEQDEEYVDPLDSEPGEIGEEPEEDPRADDPFAEEDDDPAIELKDVSAEDDGEDDPPEAEAAPETPPAPDPRDEELALLRRELEESRRSRGETEQSLRDARTKQIDGELAATRTALKAALEDGDTDKQIELNEQLTDLKAEKRGLGEAPKQEQRPASADQPVRATPQNEAARQWMAGKAWINAPEYNRQTADLIDVAQQVARDNLDPASPAYYEEVERRMRLRHPSLLPTTTTKTAPPPRKPGNQRVGVVSRDDPPRPNGAGQRVVLTQEDIRNMKAFGLDPNDKDVVKEYARNKVKTDDDARR